MYIQHRKSVWLVKTGKKTSRSDKRRKRDWRKRGGIICDLHILRARKSTSEKNQGVFAASRSRLPPHLEREFVAVPRLCEALPLNVASPLVILARTYAPLASVAGGRVGRCLTGRFATSSPQGEQDAQDAEDNSCDAEGDANGVTSGKAAGGEAGHSGGGRGFGNNYSIHSD